MQNKTGASHSVLTHSHDSPFVATGVLEGENEVQFIKYLREIAQRPTPAGHFATVEAYKQSPTDIHWFSMHTYLRFDKLIEVLDTCYTYTLQI